VPARFILSFDCEGKWGVADGLTAKHRRDLSDERLHEAYQSILDVLDEYEIQATFAFVGAFAQSPDDFARIRPDIEALDRRAPGYLGPALRDIDEANGTGWHGHHLVDAVGSSCVHHEIALHGLTHIPWTTVDEAFAEAEMRMLESLEGPVRDSRTFVYPRNLVAHTEVLARHGFEGFRTARPERSRLVSLLSEFNLFEVPEHARLTDDIVPIPAGFFLNWRSGLRGLVPPAVTRIRARRLLDSAAASGAVVHYWLHPENIASAPSTLELLRTLARDVANAREAGDCEVLTQLGYCRWVESLP
jgi:peptidoglycan/xylan/chitin deacetylase (PgdA/CDA1 family)